MENYYDDYGYNDDQKIDHHPRRVRELAGRALARRLPQHHDDSYWVNPRDRRTKQEAPYSYSPFYHWRDDDLTGSDCMYSDRMAQWDSDKYRSSIRAIGGDRVVNWSRKQHSQFLSLYLGYNVVATAFVEGCNPSNGYDYFVFYFKKVEVTNKEK